MHVLAFFAVFITVSVAEPAIYFQSTPGVIEPPFTQNLSMQCCINVTQPSSEVVHVTSLVVTRNHGGHVAMVSQYDPAKALVDLSTLEVTGYVSGNSQEKGYLELLWQYPTQAQAGTYTCEVNAISALGHNVILSKDINVDVTTPSVDDLVNHALSQERQIIRLISENKLQESKIDQQNLMINNLSSENNQQDIKINLQETKINMQETKINNQQISINQILATINAPNHIETGIVNCGDSTSWPGTDGSYDYNEITKQFSTTYDRPPIVVLSVQRYWVYHPAGDSWHDDFVNLVKVDANRFTLRCSNHNSLHVKMWISWTSFPS